MSGAPEMLPKRSKARITRTGMLYDERMKALRRIQAQLPSGVEHRPTTTEIRKSESRWNALKHTIGK